MLMFSSAYCCVLNIYISLLSLAGSAMTNILEKQIRSLNSSSSTPSHAEFVTSRQRIVHIYDTFKKYHNL